MNGLAHALEKIVLHRRWQIISGLAAGGYGAISFAKDVADAYASNDYSLLIPTGLFLIFLGVMAVQIARTKHSPPKLFTKGVFHGPGLQSESARWERPSEAKRLVDQIETAEAHPVVVAGPSGVGKSVLLKIDVKNHFEAKGWQVFHINSYTDLFSRFQKILRLTIDAKSTAAFKETRRLPEGFVTKGKNIIIFDQFEMYLAQSNVIDPDSSAIKEWFDPLLLTLVSNPSFHTVFVVRKEWYYDLALFFWNLNAIVVDNVRTVYFRGITPNFAAEAWEKLNENFGDVTGSPRTADALQADLVQNGEIRPVEAQIVGLVIENLYKTVRKILSLSEYRKLGISRLIETYFSSYVNAYKEPKKLSKVLFALSVQSTLRGRALSSGDLAVITYSDQQDIEDCLKFLEEHELALPQFKDRTDEIFYRLAHDYIGDKIRNSGTIQANPIDRDNIALFCNHVVNGRPHSEFCRPKFVGRLGWGGWLLLLVCVVMLFRLISPNFGLSWDWADPSQRYNTARGLIDFYYLPIAVTHLTWLIYINLAHRRFLACLRNETVWGRLLSNSLMPTGVLFAVLTTFTSPLWLSLLSITGFLFGLKLFLIAKSEQVSAAAKPLFSRFGILTMTNMTIVCSFGLAYAYFTYFVVDSQDLLAYAQIFLYITGLMMVYYMLHCRDAHVSPEATTRFLGLYDRNWPEVSAAK
jgi:hypothetical protein